MEKTIVNDFIFESQRRTFASFGYANDPSGQFENKTIGSQINYSKKSGGTVFDKAKLKQHTDTKNDAIKEENSNNMQRDPDRTTFSNNNNTKGKEKKKRKAMGDPDDIDGWKGPWAGYEGEQIGSGSERQGPTNEQMSKFAQEKAKNTIVKHTKDSEYIKPGSERSIFHGRAERDYLGRTYMHVPNDVDIDLTKESGSQECYLPKTLLHTWTGHAKGVTSISFFPKSGHLLLSASMDAKIKLWDVYHDRKILRTFIGHNKAVRDICFRSDGRQFVSCSYDKYIKLWDTETGKCIRSYDVRATPYCVRFHPELDNIFLAGCANKRIYQWDTKNDSDRIVQEYNQHMDAVNSITFIDENRRFVTTSDDKTIRVWDFDIPVVIKNIAEPNMHSMPAVAVHPNKKWLLMQSMNNQILTYSSTDKFRQHTKRFVGHITAGYACQLNMSPDGQYVISGDGEGKLWFWNWKTSKVIKSIKAHDKVTIGCEWHPQETSKVATCSWDGTIKLWD